MVKRPLRGQGPWARGDGRRALGVLSARVVYLKAAHLVMLARNPGTLAGAGRRPGLMVNRERQAVFTPQDCGAGEV